MKPKFELIADDEDLTEILKNRLVSIEVTNTLTADADSMRIVLADKPEWGPDGKRQWLNFKLGALIDIRLGYLESGPNKLIIAGRFRVAEVAPSGGSGGDIISMTATGVDLTSRQKELKTRSWDESTTPTLGDILKTIAAEYSVKPVIDPDLAAKKIPHVDQHKESDQSFIASLANRYAAIGKFKGDLLVFWSKIKPIDDSGNVITLDRGDLSSWSLSQPASVQYKSVAVQFRDIYNTQDVITVVAGSGSPRFTVVQYANSQQEANDQAAAKLAALKQKTAVLSIQGAVPLGTLLLPSTKINITDLRDEMTGRWMVQKQRLTMSSGGFTYSAQAIRPAEYHSN